MTVKKCKVTSGPATHKYYYEVYEGSELMGTFYDPIRLQHGECVVTYFIVHTFDGTFIEDTLFLAASKIYQFNLADKLCEELFKAGFEL